MLTRRERAPRHAVYENLHAGLAMLRSQPHVVGSAFVAEGRRNWAVNSEFIAGEGERELREGGGPLMAPVRHSAQIGHRQVTFAVGGVGGRRDRRGIGGPHRRSGHCVRGKFRLRLLDRCPKLRQPGAIWPRVRQKNPLGEAERKIRAHLLDSLEGCGARPRHCARIAGRSEIAEAEPGVIVTGPDNSIEIDFRERHYRETARIWSPTVTLSSSAASRSIPMPLFGSRFTDAQHARKSLRRPVAISNFVRPPSAISPMVSAVDSRTVRMRSVGEVTVGPPSKMST